MEGIAFLIGLDTSIAWSSRVILFLGCFAYWRVKGFRSLVPAEFWMTLYYLFPSTGGKAKHLMKLAPFNPARSKPHL